MFERFTPRARRVVVLAQDAAREIGHRQIKPEHLLLALKEGEGMASNAMADSGVDGASLRQRVADRLERHPSARKVDKVPFSREAKKALELSLRAALALGHNYIGTEHLLLGVQREADQRGESLDELLGVSTEAVHSRLMELVGGGAPAPLRSPAVRSAMDIARRVSGRAVLTTGHLLTAMLEVADSQAAKALNSLGLTSESVRAALAKVPVADSSDAAPSPQSVTITIGETSTLISDAEVAAALQHLSAEELRAAIKRAAVRTGPGQATG